MIQLQHIEIKYPYVAYVHVVPIQEPINNIWRASSHNYINKSVYEFYKVVKEGNFFSTIFQIVMKIIIFLYLNIKSLNYLKYF